MKLHCLQIYMPTLCFKHGGTTFKLCHAPDCPTSAIAHGLCYKHGALGVCPEPDCTSKVLVRGWCRKHDNLFNSKK
jgi:hypothetical protein